MNIDILSTQHRPSKFVFVYEKEGLPPIIDQTGKEMCYHQHVFYSAKWAPNMWVDPPAEGSGARMPTCTSNVCLGSRCIGHMYHASVLARPVAGIMDTELAKVNSIAATCR